MVPSLLLVVFHPNQLQDSPSYRSESFTPASRKQCVCGGGLEGVLLGRQKPHRGLQRQWQAQGVKEEPQMEYLIQQAVGSISGVNLEPQVSLLTADIIPTLQM